MLEGKKEGFYINNTLENVKKCLIFNGFKVINTFFTKDIYMSDASYINVKSVKDLNSYVIVENFNNENKNVILKEHGILQAQVKSINSTVQLLLKLGFKEFMSLNINIEVLKKDNLCLNLLYINNRYTYIIYNKDTSKKLTKVVYEILENNNIGYEYSSCLYIEDDILKKEE